jgi:hypothetical protein
VASGVPGERFWFAGVQKPLYLQQRFAEGTSVPIQKILSSPQTLLASRKPLKSSNLPAKK